MEILPKVKPCSPSINDQDDKLDNDRHNCLQEKELQAINYLNQLSIEEIFEATPFDLFETLLRESNSSMKGYKLNPTIRTIADEKQFEATANYEVNLKKTMPGRRQVTKREIIPISPRLIQANIESFKKFKKQKPISGMNFLQKKRHHINENSEITAHASSRLCDLKMILSSKINQSENDDNINSIDFEMYKKDNQSNDNSLDVSDLKELQSRYKNEYRNLAVSQYLDKDKVKRKLFGITPEHIKGIINSMSPIPQLSSIPEQKGQQNYDFPGLMLIDKTRTLSKDNLKVRKQKRKISSSESKLNLPSGEINIQKFNIILAEVQNPNENGAGKKLIATQFPILKSLLPNQSKSKHSSPSRKINHEQPDTLFNLVTVNF